MIRLFVPHPLSAEATIPLSSVQAHYLTGVMRQSAGDAVAVFNGRDGEWRAVLAQVSKREWALTVDGLLRPQAFGPDLELVTALVKRARLETIVEKAAELGARRVRLAITRRTNADHAKVERLRAIAAEAAEQTGRLDVPEIVAPIALEALLDGWPNDRRLMFCDEGGDARPVLEALADGGPGDLWAILIGPEGGFAPEERERLRSLAFVTPVTLGPRILRADTAAISALTLWQAAMGDWRSSPPRA
jgi:16S rRNA (uracil1498-N3)-methyltransferase